MHSNLKGRDSREDSFRGYRGCGLISVTNCRGDIASSSFSPVAFSFSLLALQIIHKYSDMVRRGDGERARRAFLHGNEDQNTSDQ